MGFPGDSTIPCRKLYQANNCKVCIYIYNCWFFNRISDKLTIYYITCQQSKAFIVSESNTVLFNNAENVKLFPFLKAKHEQDLPYFLFQIACAPAEATHPSSQTPSLSVKTQIALVNHNHNKDKSTPAPTPFSHLELSSVL